MTSSIACKREAGTKPGTSRHRLSGGERWTQSQGHHVIDCLEERGGHKARDITSSIACRREAGTKPGTSRHRLPAGERWTQSQGHQVIDCLEERGGHKARDITSSIACRREVGTKPGTWRHRLSGGERHRKRKRSPTFLAVKHEKEPLSSSPLLGLFERQCRKNI